MAIYLKYYYSFASVKASTTLDIALKMDPFVKCAKPPVWLYSLHLKPQFWMKLFSLWISHHKFPSSFKYIYPLQFSWYQFKNFDLLQTSPGHGNLSLISRTFFSTMNLGLFFYLIIINWINLFEKKWNRPNNSRNKKLFGK